MRDVTGRDAIDKFVLIRDHEQLPAVVPQSSEQSGVYGEGLRTIGSYNLKDPLSECFYHNAMRQRSVCYLQPPIGDSQSSVVGSLPSALRSLDTLCRQGRMNMEVVASPNHAFYGGLLRPVGLEHQINSLKFSPGLSTNEFVILLMHRVAFLPSTPELPIQLVEMNHSEARIIARLATVVLQQYVSINGCFKVPVLGVITSYRSQIALIKKGIAALGTPALNDILVDTVERSQKSECDIIIYSFCANRAYQSRLLINLIEENGTQIDRKPNVASTRVRKQMFITGVP